MIAGLSSYPAFLRTRIEWLPEAPSHWEVRRLRTTVAGCINGIWGADPTGGPDDIACVRVADFDRERRRIKPVATVRSVPRDALAHRLLRHGDLLIEKSGGGDQQPVGMVVAFEGDLSAVCSNFVARMPTAVGHDPHFLTYLHEYLYALGVNTRSIKQTTGIQNLDSDAYLAEPVAIPPLTEQEVIGRFLDHVTQRIGRYVATKRRLIALLEEQSQAMIWAAVTRGVSKPQGVRAAGLPWLGEIPAHWDLVANAALLKVRKRLVGGRSGEYTLLSLTKGGVVPRDLDNAKGKFPASFETYQKVEEGDLLFCLFDIDETPSTVGHVSAPGMVTGAYTRMRPNDKTLTSYLYYYYRALDDRKCLKPLYSGLRKVIRKSTFLSCKTPVPPAVERLAISRFIEGHLAETNAAIVHARREIALIWEYRRRLIGDVVTGGLDVRDAAAGLSERLPPDAVADDAGGLEFSAEVLGQESESDSWGVVA
jgi:type I restriction enzyme, S subunit